MEYEIGKGKCFCVFAERAASSVFTFKRRAAGCRKRRYCLGVKDAIAIFGAIDAAACTEEFAFGQDGKPHFMAGPYDSPERCRVIISRLLQSCGAGGFHYTIPFGMPSNVLPEVMRRKPARLIGPDENPMRSSQAG